MAWLDATFPGNSAPPDGLAAGAVTHGDWTAAQQVQTDALLEDQPKPSDSDIREALSGTLCPSTGYENIMDAERLASARKCATAASE